MYDVYWNIELFKEISARTPSGLKIGRESTEVLNTPAEPFCVLDEWTAPRKY